MCDFTGGGERVVDSGEGEAVYGDEADSAEATGAGGGRTAADLPTDTQGKDKTNEGMRLH